MSREARKAKKDKQRLGGKNERPKPLTSWDAHRRVRHNGLTSPRHSPPPVGEKTARQQRHSQARARQTEKTSAPDQEKRLIHNPLAVQVRALPLGHSQRAQPRRQQLSNLTNFPRFCPFSSPRPASQKYRAGACAWICESASSSAYASPVLWRERHLCRRQYPCPRAFSCVLLEGRFCFWAYAWRGKRVPESSLVRHPALSFFGRTISST